MTAAEFLAQLLQSDKVPTLPGVATEVLRLSADEEVDLRLIATTISHDASLSAKILQYVNSPLYGFTQSIGTLSQAVAILGMDAVRSLVLSFTLVDAAELSAGSTFDYQRFWERSLAMAVAAQRIVGKCPAASGEEAFLAGLLANLGEVFLARAQAPQSAEVKPPSTPDAGTFSLLGITHGELGGAIARHWGLPAFLVAAMHHHEDPQLLPLSDEKTTQIVSVVHLAEILADMFYATAPQKNHALFLQKSRELLDVDATLFEELAASVHTRVQKAAGMFGIRVNLSRSLQQILQQALLQIGRINLEYEQKNRELVQRHNQLVQENIALLQKVAELETLANMDALTQVYNRHFFQKALNKELHRAKRTGQSLGLVLADVDAFKRVNDTYGHPTGDFVLRELCTMIQANLRPYDVLARYGGEEFVLILPQTDIVASERIAERLRRLVEGYVFRHADYRLQITLCFGVSACTPQQHKVSSESLIALADACLLQAKAQGKNQVVAKPYGA